MASAQAPQSGVPISVEASTIQVDAPTDNSTTVPAPGLSLRVRNTSARSIRAYSILITFTNPTNGTNMGRHVKTICVPSSQSEKYILPGHSDSSGALNSKFKPIALPTTDAGVPAQYAFSVDLVIFDDGTEWGPAKMRESVKLRQVANQTK